MTARELLTELQKLDEEELDRPVWIQFKDSLNLVFTDEATEVEPTIWSTGELTVTIRGKRAIWKEETVIWKGGTA
ncbi:MAG: hypothetical protein Q4C88_06840 [Akkermansia sp.]|nr:hypothetical protein [Akkermansia sp.]